MKKQVHVSQPKAKLRIPAPMKPVLQGPMAPRTQEPGQEIDNAMPAGTQVAGFSDQAGAPKAKPGVRRAAQIANKNRPARPLTPRFKALTFGTNPTNPFK